MATFEFRLPDIGEGIAEGEVVAWHVAPGQAVVEDQEMVEVMTDKATVTIGCPRKGRISQLNATVGERVKVGSVLVVIELEGVRASPSAEERKEARPSRYPPGEADTARSRFQAPAARAPFAGGRGAPVATRAPEASLRQRALRTVKTDEPQPRGASDGVSASAVGDIREDLPGASYFGRQQATQAQLAAGAQSAIMPAAEANSGAAPDFFAEKPLATPATRKLARDLGVDLRHVAPTGPNGRVTKDDVRGSLPDDVKGDAREERKPFVGLRRRIAERMQLAKTKAAHFTFVEEVEVDSLMAVIARLKGAADKAQVKLHYLPFIVKAATLALKKHPILNSMLDEAKSELVYRHYYNIGVAAATDAGLVVPVVRDADQKSVLEIARDIARLSEGARSGKLTAGELTGSTFTITSLGKQGGLLATPVLNYPEVGILGVHRVKERPVVRDGQIVIGNVMNLSLSLDHRIVDGHVGAAFAYDLIAYLEQPDLLLLELA